MASWNARFAGKKAGKLDSAGYFKTRVNGVAYFNHRLVFKLMTGNEPQEIDHINMNPSDNRLSNLRSCTRSQNQGNRIAHANNASGYKGIHLHHKKWAASIYHAGKKHYLGRHETKELAATAYAEAAVRLFGEYARAK